MDAMLAEVDAQSAAEIAWSSDALSAAAAAEQRLLERAAAIASG
jgi:hypothetical protein